ncbi:MAG TPA: DNA-3-methyladenine glycosylase [Solirubrobacteraceae bacterium]|jgi:DNA-3-methyladenine glycosylase|nr:DNA-3-methyladenine glycosylase [Solirubrobacteraceae bacterium]
MTVLGPDFYERPVLEVAADLIGCTVRHGGTAGVIVETEAYHEEEPACHAFIGLTARTRVLFGRPGTAYVYRSYGIHALLNAVCEREGIGAAVLIRALAPSEGLEAMMRRRAGKKQPLSDRELCSGPGRLTQALGIELETNGSALTGAGPIRIEARKGPASEVIVGPRIGITKAVELPWRFCAASDPNVSRSWSRRGS